MIGLEITGEASTTARIAERLLHLDGVHRVRVVGAARPGRAILSAVVRPQSTDAVLEELRRHDVADSQMTLTRLEVIGRAATGQVDAGLVWEDVLGMAWLYSRPLARYLLFMIVAGVIAGYGVVDRNGILIVGAMAVSPDLLPIVGVAVGVVGARLELAGRALLTLAAGLGAASAVAAVSTFVQDRLDAVPSGFDINSTGILGTLTTVGSETVVVALAAGVAGMLALETRASAGVGVAISVTTIPAAAYLGVAAGLGETDQAWGALAVLAVNVAMLVTGASATLALQRLRLRRALRAAADADAR